MGPIERAYCDNLAKTADFWWGYEANLSGDSDAFKAHAVQLYRKALADGSLEGLNKNLAEKRCAEMAQKLQDVCSASGVASSTSAGAVGKGGWKEKGNTATLALANGEILEVVKCPAGPVEFRLGYKEWQRLNIPSAKRAKITRPFWIMTRPLAKRNFRSYGQCHSDWNGEDAYDYPLMNALNVESFAETITDECRASLPKGCVVRSPTLAEWAYATKANSRATDDPYVAFDDKHSVAASKIYAVNPQGKSPKNKWGLHEFFDAEHVLDKLSDGGYHMEMFLRLSNKAYFDVNVLTGSPGGDGAHGRLVVGPDLVSEWKAKHGKK